MSQLVAFHDGTPVDVRGGVEIEQPPMTSAVGTRSAEGVVRPGLVYVRVASEAGPFLVPFGDYDVWSLQDCYNEAIRIMNTLGAAQITCETFGESSVRRSLRATLARKGADPLVDTTTTAGVQVALPTRCNADGTARVVEQPVVVGAAVVPDAGPTSS